MALVLSDVGAAVILNKFFKDVAPTGGVNLTLKLFTSNTTPADTDTAATYTEAAGGGYAAKTLTAANWTVAQVSGIATASYAQQEFTFTGALTDSVSIYGYFVVDADGVLVYAERAAAAYTPANNGDKYNVTPEFQLSKGTPT